MLIHEHALVKMREDMPMDRAALIGCSTTTGVGAVFHTAGVEPGSKVAVIGCGGVGLAAINGAAIAGAGMIIAVDMVDSKLEIAKALGATHTINPGKVDAVGEVRELTQGGCHYTFEAIGLKATTEQAWKMLCPGGTATVIGMKHALVKMREDMPMDRAALIGCSTTTGVGAVFHTAGVEPGSKVAVIGCGGVGLAAINGAAIAGAGMIIAVDMVDSKLEIAKALGATHTINPGKVDAVGEVRELTQGGCHYTFEAIGLKATTEQAWKMLCPGGTATVIGMIPVGTMVELHGADFLAEKKIQGSNMGSNRFRVDMPRFVDFYLNGKLHLDQMISKHIKLHDVNDALNALKTGEEARHIIMFD